MALGSRFTDLPEAESSFNAGSTLQLPIRSLSLPDAGEGSRPTGTILPRGKLIRSTELHGVAHSFAKV
jgi:hypothetical protein